MADTISLGLHTPCALSYLIQESILPENACQSSYRWHTRQASDDSAEEELLYTPDCVVWSIDGNVKRVFKFNGEDRKVSQALLTTFPYNVGVNAGAGHVDSLDSTFLDRQSSGHDDAHERMQRTARWGTKAHDSRYTLPTASSQGARPPQSGPALTRALVILLAAEVQVHYLSGPSHVVSLPFEVQEAFPSLHGMIVRRKLSTATKDSPSPRAHPAPATSFFSQSCLLSHSGPKLPLSFPSTAATGQDSGATQRLDALFRAIGKDDPLQGTVDVPVLYSLSDPLSDIAAVSHASISRTSRFRRLEERDEVFVEYDPLDQDEEVVYLSAQDELTGTVSAGSEPLLFMVTMNKRLEQITVWQYWYLKPQSLSYLLSQRAALKATKIGPASSFTSASRTNGTTTPAMRHRDRARESFANSARLPSELATSQHSGVATQSQNDEEAMASQMDPDYLPLKQPTKSSKRVSSLLSRAEVVTADPSIRQTALGASFGGGSRRGPSIGSFHDRRSFGSHAYRKSRGSTPGSVFSRSLGQGDDLTEPENRPDDSNYLDDEYQSIGKLISATRQAIDVDAAFGGGADGSRKEIITRKLDSIPLYWQPGQSLESAKSSIKVLPLVSSLISSNGDSHIDVYVLDKSSGNMTTLSYRVRIHTEQGSSNHEPASGQRIPIPVMEDRRSVTKVHDMERLRDGRTCAILYSTAEGGANVVPMQGLTWPVTLPKRVRLLDPTNLRFAFAQTRREVGRARTTEVSRGPFALRDPSRSGQVTMAAADGQAHRLQILLCPRNTMVKRILQVCQSVLQGKEGRCIPTLWCSIYHRFTSKQPRMTSELDSDWEALIVALFTLTAGSIGRPVRIDSRHRGQAPLPHKTTTVYDGQLETRSVQSETINFPNEAWNWIRKTQPRPKHQVPSSRPKRRVSTDQRNTGRAKVSMAEYEAIARHFLQDVAVEGLEWLVGPDTADSRTICATKIMLALHLVREESRLDINSEDCVTRGMATCLSAVIAQFGHWLGLENWDCKPDKYYGFESTSGLWEISSSVMRIGMAPIDFEYPEPPSVYEWVERSLLKGSAQPFISLEKIARIGSNTAVALDPAEERMLLPRIASLQQLSTQFARIRSSPDRAVEIFAECGLSTKIIQSLPEAVLAPIREAVIRCQCSPPTTWPLSLLRFVGRDDLILLSDQGYPHGSQAKRRRNGGRGLFQTHDMQNVYASADRAPLVSKTHEAERHAVISLIFSEDRRLVDALRLLNPTSVQLAECPPQPEWSEVEHLDQQKRVVNWVMIRTIALAPGFAMIHFESQRPLLSEHFPIKGFSTSCQMKPMDNTISADRSNFTEERFGWAFFHSGVSAGLSISQDAKGIDTSWIVFNKPNELGNRHAGFLLALGINGHLRTLAKWLAFKYLTPKHNMTSIGLLLGLSASYIGTMDSLITRMLSVHITRMLPPGAAELNVSPSTQTAGLMGIGLLYYNTQHRRMSEVMLSEIEHREIEDPGSTMDVLRDESYRLAAGFALGYINIGKGRNLQGLRSMHLLERLLNVAIGPRPVDLVHVVDKATAGAVIAVTLIYMKTGDQSVAQKIDIPDTVAQLEHVRPDLLLLRTLAKHLIMWNEITDKPGWICSNLPQEFRLRYYGHEYSGISSGIARNPQLQSDDVPFFNIITGLAWSLGLRFAGSGNCKARDEVLGILRMFNAVAKQEAYYYDAKLARNTVRRCIDMLGLSAATIMAGTGDLETFRYLRALHGRVDAETLYGSHMAAHLAIGTLFLGGGTYTFGTSNFAIAALICAFYPLFPSEVSDNRVHLQAFRHLWVFAAEPRCLVVQDVDTARPVSMKLKVVLRDGTQKTMTAPCLLPELDTVARVSTQNPTYWEVTLDFVANPKHLLAFRRHQTIHVRRSQAYEFSSTVFSSALTALNDVQSGAASTRGMWKWILTLPAFRDFDQALLDLVLPPDVYSAVYSDEQGTVCDTRLVLNRSVDHLEARDELWNLRLLFSWAQDAVEQNDGRLRWIGQEAIDMLRAKVSQRLRTIDTTAN